MNHFNMDFKAIEMSIVIFPHVQRKLDEPKSVGLAKKYFRTE